MFSNLGDRVFGRARARESLFIGSQQEDIIFPGMVSILNQIQCATACVDASLAFVVIASLQDVLHATLRERGGIADMALECHAFVTF